MKSEGTYFKFVKLASWYNFSFNDTGGWQVGGVLLVRWRALDNGEGKKSRDNFRPLGLGKLNYREESGSCWKTLVS